MIDGTVPEGGRLRITNLRTGESITVPISPSGQFTAAFVDMNRNSVVAMGDEILTQIIGTGNAPLTEAKRHIISHEQIAHAYLLTHLSARPEQNRLLQNYPNPFNPETWIPYQIAQDAQVKIKIFNVAGKLIRRIESGNQAAGWYMTRGRAAYWDGCNETGEVVSSGIYFYKLRAGNYSAVRKLLIVK